MLKQLLLSCRPKQWIKNLFVLTALVFSFNLFNPAYVLKALQALLCFCIASSGVYLLNDLLDLEQDREHPEKRLRPIASGRLDLKIARVAIVSFLGVALIWGLWLDVLFGFVLAIYVIVNILYSNWLKYLVIIDVMMIALCFTLRVVGGAVVLHVEISEWTLMCVISLSIFLGLSKRRHESTILQRSAKNHRAVLMQYNPYLLDQMIGVMTASTLIFYMLFTVSDRAVEQFGSKNLILSIPFVIYGIFRYLYLVHRKDEGGNPTDTLVMDKPLLLNVMLWVICMVFIIYWSV